MKHSTGTALCDDGEEEAGHRGEHERGRGFQQFPFHYFVVVGAMCGLVYQLFNYAQFLGSPF